MGGVKSGDKTTTAKLEVQALKDVSEHVGGSATFKYKLPHEGAPIEWIHNGKQIHPERDPQKYTIVTDGLVKTLVIKDLKEDEQGTFGVKVGDKTTTAKLGVQALKDVSERIGGSAIFKYKLPNEGAPMEWIHNGKRIFPEKDPQKYEIIKDGLNRTLVMKNLKEQEQGSISVKIADKTSTAKLKVQAMTGTEKIKDVTERVGGSASFKCQLPYEGAPVEWTHNGKRIYPEKDPQKYEIISDGLNKVLIIKNIGRQEEGTMGVKVGETVSNAKIKVKGAGEDVITPAAVQTTQTAAQYPAVVRHSQVEKPHDTQQPWKSHEIDVDTKVYQTQVTQQEGNRSVPQGQTNVMQMANVQQRTPSFTQPNDSPFMDKNLVAKPSDYQQPFGSSKTYTSEAQTMQESSVQEFPSFGQQEIFQQKGARPIPTGQNNAMQMASVQQRSSSQTKDSTIMDSLAEKPSGQKQPIAQNHQKSFVQENPPFGQLDTSQRFGAEKPNEGFHHFRSSDSPLQTGMHGMASVQQPDNAMSQISLVEKPKAFGQAMTDSNQTTNQMKTMPKNTIGPWQKSSMQEFPSFTQSDDSVNRVLAEKPSENKMSSSGSFEKPTSFQSSHQSHHEMIPSSQKKASTAHAQKTEVTGPQSVGSADKFTLDRPYTEKPTPAKGTPSKLQQNEQKEISSNRPHSETQMPQKGVPSKLLQHEKKETPSTKPSTTNTTQYQSQQEPGNSGAPFFNSSETPNKVSGSEMDFHKISSQQQQVNQKTDIPGRPPQNQTSQQQTSLESDTENFQDNSSSKPWSPNQETSTMRPHSEIQMPQKGVPSKLLQHEKRDSPSTKPSTAITTQNQSHQEPGKSGAPFFNSTEIFKKASGSDNDSHKTSSQQKQLNQKTDIPGYLFFGLIVF